MAATWASFLAMVRRSRSSSVARALMVQPRGVMAMMCVSRDGSGTCVLGVRLIKE